MTFTTHFVNTRLIDVDVNGTVIDQNNPATQIHDILVTEQQHRVIPDPDVPNSTGWPTVPDYIAAEGDSDFELKHLDQFTIVTQRDNP